MQAIIVYNRGCTGRSNHHPHGNNVNANDHKPRLFKGDQNTYTYKNSLTLSTTSPLPYYLHYIANLLLNYYTMLLIFFIFFVFTVQVMEAPIKHKWAPPLTNKSCFNTYCTISQHRKKFHNIRWIIIHTPRWRCHKLRLNLLRMNNYLSFKRMNLQVHKVARNVSDWKSACWDHSC